MSIRQVVRERPIAHKPFERQPPCVIEHRVTPLVACRHTVPPLDVQDRRVLLTALSR